MTSRKGRKPKPYSQAARINLMARRLTGGATVTELAEEFDITKRQVHRDLQHLEEAGFPLLQEDGRYRLPPGFKGMEIVVSPFELLSLYLAKSHLDYCKAPRCSMTWKMFFARSKLDFRTELRTISSGIVTSFAPLQRPVRAYAEKRTILDVLRNALLRQRTVVLRGYQKPESDQPTDYQID